MISEKKIKEEKKQVVALKTIIDVYGEVAAVRMKNTREFVLKNRNFLSEIENVFKDCLSSYAKKLSDMVKQGKIKKGGKVTFLGHNGQTVSVLISANTGFYGSVVQDTFKKFIGDIRSGDTEVTIIGNLGVSLFLESEPSRPYTYFSLPDYGVDRAALASAIAHLVQYEEIRLYFGRYISVVTQKPDVYKISAGTPIAENVVEPKVHYIFEPSVEKILMFFETQIFASLFDQALRESQLAKFASRILAMEEANQNIRTEAKRLDLATAKLRHRNSAKKQLNMLPAIMTI